jgi:transposase-like protein
MSKTYIDKAMTAVEERLDIIIAMLNIGHTRTACAKATGLKPAQLFDVIRKGKHSQRVTDRAAQILLKINEAEGNAQVRLEGIIIKDAEVNVKTAQWLLARRFRLKERHEPELDVLRKMDHNRLDQEEIKLKILEQKLRLLLEKSGEDMTADDWRALMTEGKEANKRLKSLH